jgi:hypothetical protein
MENVNWLSLIVASIVPMIVGYVYYHEKLFGSAWMESIGMTKEKQESGNMGMIIGLSFIASFLVSFFLMNFNNGPGQEAQFDTFSHGAAHGLVLTIFLVGPIFVSNGLFEQKGWKNTLINIGYWGITLAIMGGVVDAMNHWPNVVESALG